MRRFIKENKDCLFLAAKRRKSRSLTGWNELARSALKKGRQVCYLLWSLPRYIKKRPKLV
jgi:hypothetical protein